MAATVFILMGLFMILRVPIGISIGFASIIGLLMYTDVSIMIVAQRMFSAVNNFSMMALPFFILAGELMSRGGISDRLIRFASAILGSTRGGLAQVSVLSCMFFAAMSGSGVATTAAVGGSLIPKMVERGYDNRFSTALTCTAGALGPIIPPSILFVTYGVVANVSIGGLFIGGILPGVLIGLALMIVVYAYSVKRNYRGEPRAGWKELFVAFRKSILALFMPFIILGGIYGGFFTPTEAAIVATTYSIFLGVVVYREISLKELPALFLRAGITSATILFIVGTAFSFSWLLTSQNVPAQIAQAMVGFTSNKYIMLLLVNIVLLIAGCVIDLNATIIVLTPILLPAIVAMGIDPLHFGVIMVTNMSLGLVTPPLGLNLYVGAKISDLSVEDISKGVVPFLLAAIFILLLVTYIPPLATFLPQVLMG